MQSLNPSILSTGGVIKKTFIVNKIYSYKERIAQLNATNKVGITGRRQ